MPKHELLGSKLYRLEVGGNSDEPARLIEFAADGPESALHAAQRHSSGESIKVFEDGRPLASVRLVSEHGFWTIGPAPGSVAESR